MSADSSPLPAFIAGYRVVSRLGAGGMGEVLLAEDTRRDRKVAIRRLLPSSGRDARAARRLMTEARAVARLDHPNICGIYEVGEDGGTPFIVMPVIEGETLASRLRSGALPMIEAISIAAQIADALAAAHTRGILHRDIKPANVMVGAGNHVRVMDFGLATVSHGSEEQEVIDTVSRLTQAGTTVGTLAYMSPEQARGETIDAADVRRGAR